MGPGAIRHAENLFPTGLLVEIHDLLGDDAAVGIEVVLLVIAPHDRELGPVDHAEFLGTDAHGDRGDDVDLELGRAAFLVAAQGLVAGPRFAEDLLPKLRVGAGEAAKLKVGAINSRFEAFEHFERKSINNSRTHVLAYRPHEKIRK